MILQQDQEAPQEQVRRKALWHFATASPGVATLAPGPHWQAPAQGREVLSPAIARPPSLVDSFLFDSVTGQACQDEPSLLTKKENHTKKKKITFSSSKQKKHQKKEKKKKKTPPTLVLRGLTNGLFFFFLLSPHPPSTSSFVPY